MAGRPLEEAVSLPGVHDRGRSYPAFHSLFATEPQPFELARRMSVSVDTHPTAQVDGERQQFRGRIASFRTRVDLDCRACLCTGAEHDLRVEARGLASLSCNEPAGAVTKDVAVGVLHRRQHAPRHLRGFHPQLGVNAGDDDVERGEQFLVLIEGPVLQDVDFYASQDAKRGQFLVELCDHFQLGPESFCRQTTRDSEARTVVSEGEVVVPEGNGRLGHLEDRAATVRPVRVSMAVTP